MSISLRNLFEPGTIFLYFLFKDSLLKKLLKNKYKKLPTAYTTVIAVASLLINYSLQNTYDRYLDLSYIKGSIRLPNFVLLFIASDFLSTLLILFIHFLRNRTFTIKNVPTKIVLDLTRLMFVNIIFFHIVSSLWLRQTTDQLNFNYYCFQRQIAIDLAYYYLKHDRIPASLSDFTTYKINPENDSPLIYIPDDSMVGTKVVDEKGNSIVSGFDSFVGINIYKDMPERYFEIQIPTTRSVCEDKIVYPEEYLPK